jgi:peroxiredoxin
MRARGGGILAIAADELEEARRLRDAEQLPFRVLSAAGLPVLDDFGLAHPEGGLEGETIAIPAELLVAQDGTVVWQHVAGRITERAPPERILAAIEEHFPARGP